MKLACPKCKQELQQTDNALACSACSKKYQIIDGKPHLLEKQGEGFKQTSSDVLINRFKVFLKKYPLLFNFFYYSFGALLVGKGPKEAIENTQGTILNLGSGVKRVRKDVINIDFYPFSEVDVVADLRYLPFQDNSVDAVINEFVLEHVKEPEEIVKEIYRVLKPGGLVYLTVPFILTFHSSPDDYHRWTKNGFKELMKDFKEEEFGVRSGPTSALISALISWLATVFSFGFQKLYQIWTILLMILTSPLRYLDYLIYKMPSAGDSAVGFYYLGRK